MTEYTELRDGTPLAKDHWGPLPDPRVAPFDPRITPWSIIRSLPSLIACAGFVVLVWAAVLTL